MQRLILTVILALGLSSCAGTAALNSFTPDSGYTVATNLPYQKGSGLRLDVYTPTESDNAPVVVFFYGGRWTDGAKDEFKFVGEALASRGYVAVIADYRKYPAVRFRPLLKMRPRRSNGPMTMSPSTAATRASCS